MVWTIEFDKKASREFARLDKAIQKQIDKFLTKLLKNDNPRLYGVALKGESRTIWRYCVGDYRLLCNIEDEILTVIVIVIRHRREVYKK